jgi:nicotinate-nucleotide pyrophosphorylase (carboxylating)
MTADPLRLAPPLPLIYRPLLRRALREDLGEAGDLTTDSVVPAGALAEARVVARRGGRVAGLAIALDTFRLLDAAIACEPAVDDGDDVTDGALLATLRGPARALLIGERTALNLLGRLCGIATATRDLVARVEGTGASVVCTRKTTPGLRALEKYAVRCGGARNHRFGLHDAVLIKDNHVAVAGGVAEALRRARATVGHLVKIEVEIDRLDQLDEALDGGADVVMLDNMDLPTLGQAVRRVRARQKRGGRATLLEASGGIRLETARAIAETGVDLLSVGWLTHGSPSLDVALDFVFGETPPG